MRVAAVRGVRAGRELSLMGAITGVAPIVAPMIGGILQTGFGWRAGFILLGVLAVAAMLAVGGFLMQFMVQGAWGIVPAHLNELSPPSVRAVLPGFAYQLGNLAMAKMAPIQAGFAESHGGDYAYILAWTLAAVAAALIIVTVLGPERRSAELLVAA